MSNLKLEHLRTFLAVARFKSVSRAAEALHLTQPAATSRIKALEDSIGTALFDRSAAGMHLTKRGDMLLHYAEQFQHLTELVEEHVVDAVGVDRFMRLGVSETIAQSWLPDFVGVLHKKYPQRKSEISGDISVNLDAKTVSVDNKTVHLTGKEYQMLELLSLRKGTTLTKEMFLNHLYGGMDEPELKIIDVFICKLRKKLSHACSGENYIETVWGRGYVLRDPMEEVEAA